MRMRWGLKWACGARRYMHNGAGYFVTMYSRSSHNTGRGGHGLYGYSFLVFQAWRRRSDTCQYMPSRTYLHHLSLVMIYAQWASYRRHAKTAVFAVSLRLLHAQILSSQLR